MEWVKTSKQTPYVKVRSEWRVEGDKMIFDVEIPANATATFYAPAAAAECVVDGQSVKLTDNTLKLNSGAYQIVINK